MELELRCQFLSPKIQASSQARLVYLSLEVLPGSAAVALPLDVSLVIDCSNSMHILMVSNDAFNQLARTGQIMEVINDGVPAWRIRAGDDRIVSKFPRRIDFVASALKQIAEQLRPIDHYALIAFAASARTLIPNTPGTERQRLYQAAGQLERLQLGDETEMADGLALGLEELSTHEVPGNAKRVILLTDGYTRNVAQCYQWAERAKTRGVALSTLGIGNDFNEDLLIPLADASGGHAYYVEKPEDLPDILHQELGIALSITCRAMTVQLQLASNVTLRRIHRVLPGVARLEPGANQDGSYTIPLGDLEASAPPALLLELVLPAVKPGPYHPGQVAISCEDASQPGSRITHRQVLALQVETDVVEDRQPGIAKMVQKVAAYELCTRTLAEATAQDRSNATRKLQTAATRLLDMNEPSLAGMLLRQAEALEQRGQVDATITKRLRYDTRSVAIAGTARAGES